MLLAFRGSQNALPAKARGAFFVVRLSILLHLVFVGTAWAEMPCEPFAEFEPVSVHHVYDGDTLKLSDGRKLRLIGINATEMGRDGRPNQPLAAAATRAVEVFLRSAGQVSMIGGQQAKDRYGRVLAHVFNARGESLEQHLLEQGLAYHVAVPPNLSQAECLARAEARARSSGLGLWGAGGIAPLPASDISAGGFHRVQGKVTAITMGKKSWRLVLDNRLVGITYSEHWHRFDRSWYQSLQGRFIEVQGWVYQVGKENQKEWRLKVETQYGIEVK